MFKPLLDLMEEQHLDFHSTFRTLCSFKPSLLTQVDAAPTSADNDNTTISPDLHQFIMKLLATSVEQERLNHGVATSEWLGWLERYAARIEDERAEWTGSTDVDSARATEMRGANPRFVLRQWVLEDVIKRVERDSDSGKRVLAKVMHVSSIVQEHLVGAKFYPDGL